MAYKNYNKKNNKGSLAWLWATIVCVLVIGASVFTCLEVTGTINVIPDKDDTTDVIDDETKDDTTGDVVVEDESENTETTDPEQEPTE